MAELLARTSSAELTEWRAFERIDGPLGPGRGDYHAALVAATVSNSIRALGGKRGTKRVTDFLLEWDQRRGPKTPHELLREVSSINAALGGTHSGTTS
ncbi:hypothetical protein H0B56_12075 [Haloechinothrix sp. YIM 98757]|uniref:Minor tail T domain-containing protein n=1 Tax=Haloechinothrix aidingensis TaxID=2752311 RepID=A0A838AAL1_9PSEU|nr:hypothetical protein [Haloechinothrix aidingensis]MBA0126279.1 hypothetical protein [Haloechinothrix aidingensis]